MCIPCSSHSSGLWIWISKCSSDISEVNYNLNYLKHLTFQCSLVQVPAPFTWLGKQETWASSYACISLSQCLYHTTHQIRSITPPKYIPYIYPFPFISSVISLVPATRFSLPFHSVVFLCIHGCKPTDKEAWLYYTMLYRTWASMDFGTQEGPRTNPQWILKADSISQLKVPQ